MVAIARRISAFASGLLAPPQEIGPAPPERYFRGEQILLFLAAAAPFFFYIGRPLNHDIAWLLDAGSRWFAGERLYVDLIEPNPPLVFYVSILLTAGQWTKAAYLAGVCLAMAISALLCGRYRWAALAAMIGASAQDFGQRDHLALVFCLPYLAGARPTVPLGIWTFLGVGLKPYFLLIPLGKAIADRRLFNPVMLTLVGLGLAYVLFAFIAHRAYFTMTIPLLNATYDGLGNQYMFKQTIAKAILAGLLSFNFPLFSSLLGAVASYVLQGKYWFYHLVPAMGIAIFMCLIASRLRWLRFAIAAGLIWTVWTFGFTPYPDPVPADARRVLFLSPNLYRAYPIVLERQLRHVGPYHTLWPVPGAQDRPDILDQVRNVTLRAIARECPDYIVAERGLPIDYMKFIYPAGRPEGYEQIMINRDFEVWRSRHCLRRP